MRSSKKNPSTFWINMLWSSRSPPIRKNSSKPQRRSRDGNTDKKWTLTMWLLIYSLIRKWCLLPRSASRRIQTWYLKQVSNVLIAQCWRELSVLAKKAWKNTITSWFWTAWNLFAKTQMCSPSNRFRLILLASSSKNFSEPSPRWTW